MCFFEEKEKLTKEEILQRAILSKDDLIKKLPYTFGIMTTLIKARVIETEDGKAIEITFKT
jgi:hypothetical protein